MPDLSLEKGRFFILRMFENAKGTKVKLWVMLRSVLTKSEDTMSILFMQKLIFNITRTAERIKFKLSGHAEEDIK